MQKSTLSNPSHIEHNQSCLPLLFLHFSVISRILFSSKIGLVSRKVLFRKIEYMESQDSEAVFMEIILIKFDVISKRNDFFKLCKLNKFKY